MKKFPSHRKHNVVRQEYQNLIPDYANLYACLAIMTHNPQYCGGGNFTTNIVSLTTWIHDN